VGEQQRRSAVAGRAQRERDHCVDPGIGAFDDSPYDLVWPVGLHLHDGGWGVGVTEVDAEPAAGGAVALERAAGPPARDAVGGGDQLADIFARGVDADAVQDVGHCGVLSVSWAATRMPAAVCRRWCAT
jgi:hypothetical protein